MPSSVFPRFFAEPTYCYGHIRGDVLKTRKMSGSCQNCFAVIADVSAYGKQVVNAFAQIRTILQGPGTRRIRRDCPHQRAMTVAIWDCGPCPPARRAPLRENHAPPARARPAEVPLPGIVPV